MKQAKNIKVGDVVQFPWTEFAPQRRGWNGWLFRAAIVDRLYVSKSGKKCAEITYCPRRSNRYSLFPCDEVQKRIEIKYLFDFDVAWQQKLYDEGIAAEKNGEQVCWSEDIALLVNHGYIKEG